MRWIKKWGQDKMRYFVYGDEVRLGVLPGTRARATKMVGVLTTVRDRK